VAWRDNRVRAVLTGPENSQRRGADRAFNFTGLDRRVNGTVQKGLYDKDVRTPLTTNE
ncbi:MAG: hypothetical protein H6Q92_546, partial [Nitrospirae bacterium]|nr:hypothetical protein [Nitrospirota bacterium]